MRGRVLGGFVLFFIGVGLVIYACLSSPRDDLNDVDNVVNRNNPDDLIADYEAKPFLKGMMKSDNGNEEFLYRIFDPPLDVMMIPAIERDLSVSPLNACVGVLSMVYSSKSPTLDGFFSYFDGDRKFLRKRIVEIVLDRMGGDESKYFDWRRRFFKSHEILGEIRWKNVAIFVPRIGLEAGYVYPATCVRNTKDGYRIDLRIKGVEPFLMALSGDECSVIRSHFKEPL